MRDAPFRGSIAFLIGSEPHGLYERADESPRRHCFEKMTPLAAICSYSRPEILPIAIQDRVAGAYAPTSQPAIFARRVTMFGLFGRKKKPAGVSVQVIPEELWQGEVGQALRLAGMRPDDPANIVSFPSARDAWMAQSRVALELRVEAENARIQRTHPGCSVAPMYIFTEMVWKGPHGELLIEALKLTPYDEWNVRLLAADQNSAEALKLPRIYQGEIAHFQDHINALLGEMQAQHRASANFRDDMTRDIWGLANYFWEDQIKPGLIEEPSPA
jgi:hypothetical protein